MTATGLAVLRTAAVMAAPTTANNSCSSADQAQQPRPIHHMLARPGRQLRKQVLQMPFDRLVADFQSPGDQLVRHAVVEQAEDLGFFWR